MGLTEGIASRVGVEIVNRHGMILVPSRSGAVFLDECEQSNVSLLGIEGFEVEGDGIRPDMGTILDLSSLEYGSGVDEARRFVDATERADLFYEFVFAPRA